MLKHRFENQNFELTTLVKCKISHNFISRETLFFKYMLQNKVF